MRIGQVIKARQLRSGDHVLIFNSEGQTQWSRVISQERQFHGDYVTVELEGNREEQELEGKTRVVVWR